jgi:beta-N-acetylhexosaminidase
MTDDLDMGAILNHFGLAETIRLAIEAGNDLAMICHRIPCVDEALTHLSSVNPKDLQRALENVAQFKSRMTPADSWDEAVFRQRDEKVLKLRIDTLGESAASSRSPEDGKRSPVELY